MVKYKSEIIDFNVCDQIDNVHMTEIMNTEWMPTAGPFSLCDLIVKGCFPHVRSLTFGGHWVDAVLMKGISQNISLSSLSINYTQFADELSKDSLLMFFREARNLEQLELAVCSSDHMDDDVLAELAAHSRITSLSICCCGNVTEKSLLAIARACPLQHLHIGDKTLTSVEAVLPIVRACRDTIVSLRLPFADLEDPEACEILDLCSGSPIEHLWLGAQLLTSKTFAKIAEKKYQSLKTLNLENSFLSRGEANQIMSSCPKLARRNFVYTEIPPYLTVT